LCWIFPLFVSPTFPFCLLNLSALYALPIQHFSRRSTYLGDEQQWEAPSADGYGYDILCQQSGTWLLPLSDTQICLLCLVGKAH
jgi:hypothetical protein